MEITKKEKISKLSRKWTGTTDKRAESSATAEGRVLLNSSNNTDLTSEIYQESYEVDNDNDSSEVNQIVIRAHDISLELLHSFVAKKILGKLRDNDKRSICLVNLMVMILILV
ncbi:hypothetical protein HPULCUR_002415 [Helicostylum pulchrum]|uniref:Uncharacterized protein n=1 Tax=Helicostylum pulchrum TaxID=562976 RepID=A0ABP9XQI4_9FUNG